MHASIILYIYMCACRNVTQGVAEMQAAVNELKCADAQILKFQTYIKHTGSDTGI